MAQIRKAPVATVLTKVLAQKKLPPAYFDLSVEERKEVCRKLPGDLPFMPDEILCSERLEARLHHLLSPRAVTKAA